MLQHQRQSHGAARAVVAVGALLLLAAGLTSRQARPSPCAARQFGASGGRQQQQRQQQQQQAAFSSGARDAAQHRVPCFSFNETDAALLEPRLVTALQERQARVEGLEDWTQLGVRSRAELAQVAFTIPKVIHQVWLGPRPPPTDLLDTWRVAYLRKCPGWSHVLWTSHNVTGLKHLDASLYRREQTLHGQADVLRAAILYEHGGVYVDADIQWVNNHCLDGILALASTTGFLAALEPSKQFCANSVLAAVKQHPVTRQYMHVQRTLTSDGRSGAPWQTTGPLAVSAAMRAAHNFEVSRYCMPGRGGRRQALELLPGFLGDGAQPAASTMLATVLSSRYFFPVHWVGLNMAQVRNMSFVAELVRTQHPEAAMFQLGFTTNGVRLAA